MIKCQSLLVLCTQSEAFSGSAKRAVDTALTICRLFMLPFCDDFPDAFEALGCDILAGGGEIDLAGTDGGGPGSAAGDLRWMNLSGACISALPPKSKKISKLLELIVISRQFTLILYGCGTAW